MKTLSVRDYELVEPEVIPLSDLCDGHPLLGLLIVAPVGPVPPGAIPGSIQFGLYYFGGEDNVQVCESLSPPIVVNQIRQGRPVAMRVFIELLTESLRRCRTGHVSKCYSF